VSTDYVHASATHDTMPTGTVAQYVRLDVDQTSCGETSPGYARVLPDGTVRVYEFEIYGEAYTAPSFAPSPAPTGYPTFPLGMPPTTSAPTFGSIASGNSNGGGGSGGMGNTTLIAILVAVLVVGVVVIVAVVKRKGGNSAGGGSAHPSGAAFSE
jgi:hypothetical protein